MKNLISIAEHSDWLEKSKFHTRIEKWKLHRKRVDFGKQPLDIWMFVPCDEDGNVLEEPYNYQEFLNGHNLNTLCEEYQQAKERCLFGGFSDIKESPQYSHYISDGMQAVFYVAKNGSVYNKISGMKTIEDLTNKTPIFLTQTALKQIGL